MLVSTKAIFLQTIPLNEKRNLVKLFTETDGTLTFVVSGMYRAKKGKKTAFFQPLSLLEIVFENKEKKSIQFLKEVRFDYAYVNAGNNIYKISVLFFLNEVLVSALREQEANPALFSFLHSALQYLDMSDESISNFPLLLLLKLSAYMGFAPGNSSIHNEPIFLPDKLLTLYRCNFAEMNQISFTNQERRESLKNLIDYYKFHLPVFKEIKSAAILEEVLI